MNKETAELLPADLKALWTHVEKKPESRVLHVELLRRLMEKIHVQKSKALAQADQHGYQQLEATEHEIPLRVQKEFAPDLARLKAVSSDFTNSISKRVDSLFLQSMVSRGLDLGWHVWALEVEIPLRAVESYHHELVKRVYPEAVVLFVEPGKRERKSALDWVGRWYLLTSPQVKSLENWGEISKEAREPSFELLF